MFFLFDDKADFWRGGGVDILDIQYMDFNVDIFEEYYLTLIFSFDLTFLFYS